MKSIKDTLRRVRWSVVFGIFLVLLLIILVFVSINIFPPAYKGEGDIVMRSWLEPQKTKLNGDSNVWVEIKNRGENIHIVDVKAVTSSSEVVFDDSKGQEVNKTVQIGPGESRRVPFHINVNARYEGDYRIDVFVIYDNIQVSYDLYLQIKKRF